MIRLFLCLTKLWRENMLQKPFPQNPLDGTQKSFMLADFAFSDFIEWSHSKLISGYNFTGEKELIVIIWKKVPFSFSLNFCVWFSHRLFRDIQRPALNSLWECFTLFLFRQALWLYDVRKHWKDIYLCRVLTQIREARTARFPKLAHKCQMWAPLCVWRRLI